MARPFLEETFDTCARYGTAFSEGYAVVNTVDAGGNSYGKLIHPYPMLRYELDFSNVQSAQARGDIIDLFHRSFGTFGGFRLRHHSDYSSNNFVDVPTAVDQAMVPATVSPSALRWQLARWYGVQVMGQSPLRLIRKPVAGSVLVGIRSGTGQVFPQSAGWSVDALTGIVEFTNSTRTITNIVKGSTTVVTVGSGHTYVTGRNVVVSDVVGMTEINGLRAEILSTTSSTITLDINSNTFSDYVSGGQTNTAPQAGETPTAGFYFDIPVRFETDLSGVNFNNWDVISAAVNVVEILNP